MAHRQDTGKQADVNSVQYCACCAAQPQSTTATQEKCQRAASRAVVPRLCLPNRPCKTQCTYGRQQQARPQPWAGRRIRRRCAGRDDGLGCRKCASPVFRHPRRRADAPPDGRVVVLCRPSPAPSEAPGQGRPRARGPRLTPASFHFHRWERQGSRVRPRGAACRQGGSGRKPMDTGRRPDRQEAAGATQCNRCRALRFFFSEVSQPNKRSRKRIRRAISACCLPGLASSAAARGRPAATGSRRWPPGEQTQSIQEAQEKVCSCR